jgi:hypothetical protein
MPELLLKKLWIGEDWTKLHTSAVGDGPWKNRESKIEAWGVILASNAGLNSPKAPVASHLSVSEAKKKERAGHFTVSWEQQSSSPPCTPYSNEISQEISHKLPVGMAFRQKAQNFAIFSLERAKFRKKNLEI